MHLTEVQGLAEGPLYLFGLPIMLVSDQLNQSVAAGLNGNTQLHTLEGLLGAELGWLPRSAYSARTRLRSWAKVKSLTGSKSWCSPSAPCMPG